jgi:hypothetical protein
MPAIIEGFSRHSVSSGKLSALRYTATVHPPRIGDGEIRALIRELAADKALPSGASLRATMFTRFGTRGGVARVYRLLEFERSQSNPPVPTGSTELLEQELRSAQSRAERAEQREEVHQSRWAEDLDRLRRKIAALEPLAHQARAAQDTNELLRHQLRAAEFRISTLQQQLTDWMDRQEGGDNARAGLSPSRGIKQD